MTTAAPEAEGSLAKRYEPKPNEIPVIDAVAARRRTQPPAPRVKTTEKAGINSLAIDHPDASVGSILLMQAIGGTDYEFLDGLLRHLGNAAARRGKVDESELNFMLSVVKGIAPRDQVESMLAAQMAAVHVTTMTFARRLAHVDNLPQQDSAERAFNKLARTFAAQTEALKRYRTGGEQRVTVQHVHVNDGGQAIVGAVAPGTAAPGKGGGQ